MKKFPSGQYGKQTLRFQPAPSRSPIRAFAVLVFPWQDEKVLICDIARRGWCIPSGRVEPSETSEQAAHREAMEEAGASLSHMQYIGCYHIFDRGEVRYADCFTAKVVNLQDITMKEESSGCRLAQLDELPACYHLWNPLTEAVFEYSREVLGRALQRGN